MTASIATPSGSKARLFEHRDVRVRAGPLGARSAAESSQPDVGSTVMPGANGFGYFPRKESNPRRWTARKRHGCRMKKTLDSGKELPSMAKNSVAGTTTKSARPAQQHHGREHARSCMKRLLAHFPQQHHGRPGSTLRRPR